MELLRKYIISIGLVILWMFIFMHMSIAKYSIENTLQIGNLEIDRTSPKVEVIYSTKEANVDSVKVILKLNEAIKMIDGWEQVEGKNDLQKIYTKNIREEVSIEDLAGNKTNVEIHIENILAKKWSVLLEKVENSNIDYPLYANKTHEIMVWLKNEEGKYLENTLDEKKIQIQVGDQMISNVKIEIFEEKEDSIKLKISNIEGDGKLSIWIPQGSMFNQEGEKNAETFLQTDILIDNTKPKVRIEEEKNQDNSVKVNLIANENIRKIETWNWKEGNEVLYKVFPANVSYEISVIDFAGNTEKVRIEITQATQIQLRYASHNSEVGWTFGYGNYDIAGLRAIQLNPKYKTEALAFSIEGKSVENDFLQARSYVHTYWGDGAKAKCMETKKIYNHGYNPTEDTWDSMLFNKIQLQDKNFYFKLGGTGVNLVGNTNVNGEGAIPVSNKYQYLYGVSGVQMQLKDASQYSIAYQIYIEQVGWLKPSKNGEMAMYQKDKPMSAIRVALIPNSELGYLLDTWEKDTGNKVK